jgi:hypothetical protein
MPASRTETAMSEQPVSQFNLLKRLRRGLLGGLAITGLSIALTGVSMPGAMQAKPLVLGVAQAQDNDISSGEITSYAASVLEMDPYRTQAYDAIKNLLSGIDHDMSAVDMSCTGTANLNQLPRNVRGEVRSIIVNYCNQASQIVESNGLTVRRFNTITAAYPQDPGLAEQIRTALIQIQQQSAPEAGSAPAE